MVATTQPTASNTDIEFGRGAAPSFTFFDDFSNPATGWLVNDFDAKEYERYKLPGPWHAHYLSGGGYGVNTVYAWTGRLYPSPARIADSTTFTVEADMRSLQDYLWYSSYGIFFNGSKDLRQVYVVRLHQGQDPPQWAAYYWPNFLGGSDDLPPPELLTIGTCRTCNGADYAWNHMLIRRQGPALEVWMGRPGNLARMATISDTRLMDDQHLRVGFFQGNFEWAAGLPAHTYEFSHFHLTPATSFVTVSGPATGQANTAIPFTATVFTGETGFRPSHYRWQATGHSPVIHPGERLTNTISFSWSTTGVQTLTVTAGNAIGAVTGTHTISVSALLTP